MTSPDQSNRTRTSSAILKWLFYAAVICTVSFFAIRYAPRGLPTVVAPVLGLGMIGSCIALLVAALRSGAGTRLKLPLVLTGGMPLIWLAYALAHKFWLSDLLFGESPNYPPPLPPKEAFQATFGELATLGTLVLVDVLMLLGFAVGVFGAVWMFLRGRAPQDEEGQYYARNQHRIDLSTESPIGMVVAQQGIAASPELLAKLTEADVRTLDDLRTIDITETGNLCEPDQSALEKLEAYSRVSVITKDLGTAAKLIANGYDSAATIASSTQTEFVDKVGKDIGEGLARVIHENATTIVSPFSESAMQSKNRQGGDETGDHEKSAPQD